MAQRKPSRHELFLNRALIDLVVGNEDDLQQRNGGTSKGRWQETKDSNQSRQWISVAMFVSSRLDPWCPGVVAQIGFLSC